MQNAKRPLFTRIEHTLEDTRHSDSFRNVRTSINTRRAPTVFHIFNFLLLPNFIADEHENATSHRITSCEPFKQSWPSLFSPLHLLGVVAIHAVVRSENVLGSLWDWRARSPRFLSTLMLIGHSHLVSSPRIPRKSSVFWTRMASFLNLLLAGARNLSRDLHILNSHRLISSLSASPILWVLVLVTRHSRETSSRSREGNAWEYSSPLSRDSERDILCPLSITLMLTGMTSSASCSASIRVSWISIFLGLVTIVKFGFSKHWFFFALLYLPWYEERGNRVERSELFLVRKMIISAAPMCTKEEVCAEIALLKLETTCPCVPTSRGETLPVSFDHLDSIQNALCLTGMLWNTSHGKLESVAFQFSQVRRVEIPNKGNRKASGELLQKSDWSRMPRGTM